MSNQRRTIRRRRVERKEVNKRSGFLFSIMTLVTLLLGGHIYNLQTTEHEKQSSVVRGNAIKELYISPERGDIVDRNGVPVATTRALYDLVVTPERINGYRRDKDRSIADFVDTLEHFVDFGANKNSVINSIGQSAAYKNVVVKRDLSEGELPVVLANIGFIDGISIESKKVRQYPHGDTFLSPLGYVGRVDRADLNKASDVGYRLLPTDYTGKMGLESIHNEMLYGTTGIERVALNSRGRVVERQIASPPVKGGTLELSIDSELQLLARELMGDQRGAIIMTDIHTGELLTMLSTPAIDPNKFIRGLSKKESDEMFSSDSGMPLYNRAIRGLYPPASTIKPFMAMAGLSGQYIDANERVWSGPYFELGGHRFRDWVRTGHGWVDMFDAMEVSSDVYFYRLADRMGISYIHDYLSEFGFGAPTGVGLEREGSGLLPSPEWKRRVKKEPWYGGETVTVGIGQGYFMATPMQMQSAYVTLLNGGKKLTPLILKSDAPEIQAELSLNPEHVDVMIKSMANVIYGEKGTARRQGRYDSNKVRFGGKTGTGQVISSGGTLEYDNDDMPMHLRDHAWFSAFAPLDEPRIAVTVFVEHGGSGSAVAAPMARHMINKYSELYLNE
ncbi:putative Peptidoglycan D,D-transpeptidase MrdA [Vibrio chagasii]|nr:putative Peptidoglycan D,D-transpeptidase MrdA [Vibrio chagasii]